MSSIIAGCALHLALRSFFKPRNSRCVRSNCLLSQVPVTVNCFRRETIKMVANQRIAIVSVYDKTGLLDLAKGLTQQNVRILASGGTAKMIRESGMPVE